MLTSPSPFYVCLIQRLPKQLICLHFHFVCLRRCQGEAVCSMCARARARRRLSRVSVCARPFDKDSVHACVYLCAYGVRAPMRGSLNRSFILKYTVQGEMSDELFRDISHRRKKVFLEVVCVSACVGKCVCVCVCGCRSKREREVERVSGCCAGHRGDGGGAHLQSAIRLVLSMCSHNCRC